jgi:NADH-quinone oxidoreductase subunit N
MSEAYMKGRVDERGEYYFLLMLAALGACILASSASFASLFLGLELMSMPLFSLIAYKREEIKGARSAFMYLILAGLSSAFLLFGMALVYFEVGSLQIAKVAGAAGGLLVRTGLGFMAVGIGFKLAVVPFHLWTPDIYDGAPAPVSGFIATVSKGAMAVLLVRFFAPTGIAAIGAFAWIFAVISALSMFVGNLLALRENNIKRMLAYSSIAHLGYLLVAFVASGPKAAATLAFYLVAYFVSTLGAFAAVTALSTGGKEADRIDAYCGLSGRRPFLTAGLTAALLSLAGLPLTAGFMGKFVLFAAGEGALLWVLVVILAINSTISLFYYLRVVSLMYRPEAEPRGAHAASPGPGMVFFAAGTSVGERAVPLLAGITLALMVLAILALGLYPGPAMNFIQSLVPAL